VPVYLIDTNAVKETNIRLGTVATAIPEPTADTQHFAAEHGRPASEVLLMKPQTAASIWHGEVFEYLQNSVFNARTFFQVGEVKPSHRNLYGGRLTGLLPKLGYLSGSVSQRRILGMVNGNVLVPLASERTPLTTDPEKRAIVQRYLSAYPDQLPNRTDFDIRALNTNASQTINETNGTGRLDTPLSKRDRLFSSYSIERQHIDAFQLVAGQNPDTEIHSQRAKLTWVHEWSPRTVLTFGASYQRNRSVLQSEPNAVGPRVRFGYQIEELGPDSSFPVNRATNTFRYGGQWTQTRAAHAFSAGGDVTRFQLNGIEASNSRGYFQFMSGGGRSAIENLLWGLPASYEATIGDLNRGYRNWVGSLYFADRWKVHPRLSVYYGLRYSLETTPTEVHGKEILPYGCDCNNVSPRLGLTWQIGKNWLARAMFADAYAQILPVTYQQIRNNPPSLPYVQVQQPDLAYPLAGIDVTDPNLRYTRYVLSPDLVSPYSHQYNAVIEKKFHPQSTLRLAYIGSRSFKLLNNMVTNRAEVVPGVPLTLATVDQRRADQRYYEIRQAVNAGIAYFDAGQVTWDFALRRGLAGGASYTFSKAMDEGADFSSTAANKDLIQSRPQSQYDSLKDRKGLSTFDSPHALNFFYAWELPSPSGRFRAWLGGWQLSGINTWKTGTPLTLFVGSDSPGFGNVDGAPSDRPNILDPSILGMTIGNPDTAPLILRRDRFSYIRPGDLRGNLGRNTFRKSQIWNWNASLLKQWRFANEWTAQVRGDVFNLSNTPQFDEPQRNLSSASFGKITNTLNDGRIFQLGLRFAW